MEASQSETRGKSRRRAIETQRLPTPRWLRSTAEWLYTDRLLNRIKSGVIPHHVAMILDGNRRFAFRTRLAQPTDGHRAGADKVGEVLDWCDELGIETITLWGLSIDNLRRPKSELAALYATIEERIERLRREHRTNPGRRQVRALGRLDLLPPSLVESLRSLERETAGDGPRRINLALAYGGREELADAFRRLLLAHASRGESLADVAQQIDVDDVCRYLYAPDGPEPDLIIRTSGETRLSGFLLWQSVYSELYFCDSLWPDFRKLDFLRAIRNFQSRQRRYGR